MGVGCFANISNVFPSITQSYQDDGLQNLQSISSRREIERLQIRDYQYQQQYRETVSQNYTLRQEIDKLKKINSNLKIDIEQQRKGKYQARKQNLRMKPTDSNVLVEQSSEQHSRIQGQNNHIQQVQRQIKRRQVEKYDLRNNRVILNSLPTAHIQQKSIFERPISKSEHKEQQFIHEEKKIA